MSNKHQKFYKNNISYSKFLETQKSEEFRMYTDKILKYSKKNSKVLDVGCGTGIALNFINKKLPNAMGIEISDTSISICKNKKIKCQHYNGKKIPFDSKKFDVVGSYNVLEHTNNPTVFLDEKFRVLKLNGYLIIACPNFLSISNSYHHHTRGFTRKIKNFLQTIKYLLFSKTEFKKMKTVNNNVFLPDDDAVNVTNPISILRWSQDKKLELKFWSSQVKYKDNQLINALDKTYAKVFLGAVFMVFKKTSDK